MKNRIPVDKQGSTLVVVMVLVITFSLMTLALLQVGHFNALETVQQLRTAQAHWLAEAGLERTLSWVAASQAYRQSLPASEPVGYGVPFTELEPGQYAIKVWSPATSRVIIQSAGTTTKGGHSDTVTLQLSLHYVGGITGGVNGLNITGHTHINDDVVLDGSAYRNGTMQIDGQVSPDYSAYATAPPITGDGEFIENFIPDPVQPIVDPHGRFADLLNYAANTNNPAVTTGTFAGPLSGTVYVNGDLDISEGISGSGTLVVYGNLTFDGNNKSISDDVEVVVEGNISFDQHTSFGNDVEIFSEDGNISLNHDVDGGTAAFIAKHGSLGHITVDYNNSLGRIDESNVFSAGHDIGNQNSTKPSFSGIFYAEYDIVLRHKADFNGKIIAGRNIEIGHSSSSGQLSITDDPAVLEGEWEIEFGNDIVILNSNWQEIRFKS